MSQQRDSPLSQQRDSPLSQQRDRQETVVQKTDLDLSKFEGSHDDLDGETRGEAHRANDVMDQAQGNDRGGNNGRGEPMSLGDILQRRSAAEADDADNAPRRRRSRADVDPEERERLRAFLEDFARELGDEAPLSSTITRTLTIFTAAKVPPEQWSELLYQARGLTQEHTAQIRKLATGGEEQMRRKNKMPYFLATLEQLVGLRPAARDDT